MDWLLSGHYLLLMSHEVLSIIDMYVCLSNLKGKLADDVKDVSSVTLE